MADLIRSVSIIFQGQDAGAFAAATTLGEKMDALGLRGMKAADALAIIAQRSAELEAAAKKGAAGVEDLNKSTSKAEGVTAGAVSAYGALQRVLATLGAAAIVKDFFDANIQFERTSLTLNALTGNSAATARELEFVRAVAYRLGLDVGGAADAYAKLIAASKGTQIEGEPARRIFEATAAAMATLGKNTSDTSGVLNAITQIISKGTVQSEELRGQIGDRLPGAFNIAARAIGVTTAELDDMMKKGQVAAADFLPKFAAELERTFGTGGNINTYQAEVARLSSALDQLYVAIGQTGVIEGATNKLNALTRFVQEATVGVGYYKDGWTEIARFLKGDITYSEMEERLLRVERAAQQATAGLDAGVNQSLAETNRLLRQNQVLADAAFAGDQTEAETQRLIRQNKVLEDSVKNRKAVDDALTSLGVNAKKFANDFDQVALSIKKLFENPETTGEQALAGFEAALKRVRSNADLNAIGGMLTDAFVSGKLKAEDFDRGVAALIKTQTALNKGVKDSTDSIDKQAEKAAKAEKAARDYALELEKLASNERIKKIEATVTLKVADLEANTKRVQAAFESINNTVNSTEKSLGDLFGVFKDPNLSFAQIAAVRNQIELENRRRDEALRLQSNLTEAQIEQIRAQTRAVEKGDSIIKVDGAGLQPHLEAFMWEILRTIQVRVNADGLKMLLGT